MCRLPGCRVYVRQDLREDQHLHANTYARRKYPAASSYGSITMVIQHYFHGSWLIMRGDLWICHACKIIFFESFFFCCCRHSTVQIILKICETGSNVHTSAPYYHYSRVLSSSSNSKKKPTNIDTLPFDDWFLFPISKCILIWFVCHSPSFPPHHVGYMHIILHIACVRY